MPCRVVLLYPPLSLEGRPLDRAGRGEHAVAELRTAKGSAESSVSGRRADDRDTAGKANRRMKREGWGAGRGFSNVAWIGKRRGDDARRMCAPLGRLVVSTYLPSLLL